MNNWLIPETPATKKQRQTLHILHSYFDRVIANVTKDEASTIIETCIAVLDRAREQEEWLWWDYYQERRGIVRGIDSF